MKIRCLNTQKTINGIVFPKNTIMVFFSDNETVWACKSFPKKYTGDNPALDVEIWDNVGYWEKCRVKNKITKMIWAAHKKCGDVVYNKNDTTNYRELMKHTEKGSNGVIEYESVEDMKISYHQKPLDGHVETIISRRTVKVLAPNCKKNFKSSTSSDKLRYIKKEVVTEYTTTNAGNPDSVVTFDECYWEKGTNKPQVHTPKLGEPIKDEKNKRYKSTLVASSGGSVNGTGNLKFSADAARTPMELVYAHYQNTYGKEHFNDSDDFKKFCVFVGKYGIQYTIKCMDSYVSSNK